MSLKQKDYYVCAHSAQGFKNLISTNISDLTKVFIITGDCSKFNRKLLAILTDAIREHCDSIEYIHSCFEPDALDGIIIRDKQFGIFTDSIIDRSDKKHFDFEREINTNLLLIQKANVVNDSVTNLKMQEKNAYRLAYQEFAKAINIHDEWEKIYISQMDYEKANIYTNEIIKVLFKDAKPQNNKGTTRYRFFGGATCNGSIDKLPDIIHRYGSRYYVKGRPGSGKSTMLKKIQAEAESMNYDVEVYRCGLDTNSYDMIAIDALDFCIFDSTAPHEYFPDSDQDTVIDMYARCITPKTDETYQEQLDEIKKRYGAQIHLGVTLLSIGKKFEDKRSILLEQYLKRKLFKRYYKELIKEVLNCIKS